MSPERQALSPLLSLRTSQRAPHVRDSLAIYPSKTSPLDAIQFHHLIPGVHAYTSPMRVLDVLQYVGQPKGNLQLSPARHWALGHWFTGYLKSILPILFVCSGANFLPSVSSSNHGTSCCRTIICGNRSDMQTKAKWLTSRTQSRSLSNEKERQQRLDIWWRTTREQQVSEESGRGQHYAHNSQSQKSRCEQWQKAYAEQ